MTELTKKTLYRENIETGEIVSMDTIALSNNFHILKEESKVYVGMDNCELLVRREGDKITLIDMINGNTFETSVSSEEGMNPLHLMFTEEEYVQEVEMKYLGEVIKTEEPPFVTYD